MTSPPLATLAWPTSFTFIAGIPADFMLLSRNAITPVSWTFQKPDTATWLRFQDNGNGTAGLLGTPPAGVSEEFSVMIRPQAQYTLGEGRLYPVRVVNIATFTSPNIAAFVVGTYGSTSIARTPDRSR